MDLLVSHFVERVQVLADRTLEEERTLRDVRDLTSQLVQADVLDVNSIYLRRSLFQLNESEERLKDGALP